MKTFKDGMQSCKGLTLVYSTALWKSFYIVCISNVRLMFRIATSHLIT